MAIQLYVPACAVPLKIVDFAARSAPSAMVLVKIAAWLHVGSDGPYSEKVIVPLGATPPAIFTVSKILVPVAPPGDGVEVNVSECLPMVPPSLPQPLRASVLLLSPP